MSFRTPEGLCGRPVGRPARTLRCRCPGASSAAEAAAENRYSQASETYHGPRSRRCAAARERYHKLSGVGLSRLPNVTNGTDVTEVRRAPERLDRRGHGRMV